MPRARVIVGLVVLAEALLLAWLWPSVWALPVIVATEIVGLTLTIVEYPDEPPVEEGSTEAGPRRGRSRRLASSDEPQS